MSLKFHRRLNFGSGVGLNISKSGATPGIRSKMGSISSKGFSIRSGIKGLNYRQSWGKGIEGAIFGAIAMVFMFFITAAFWVLGVLIKYGAIVLWYLLSLTYNLICWTGLTIYDNIKLAYDNRKLKKQNEAKT